MWKISNKFQLRNILQNWWGFQKILKFIQNKECHRQELPKETIQLNVMLGSLDGILEQKKN